MFSSPTPAPGSRGLASNALRRAGLMDADARMKDLTDQPGGRKGSSKIRSHRARPIDEFKGTSGTSSTRGSSSRLLAGRIAPASDPLGGRGSSRPTAAGRVRRGALSGGTELGVRVKMTPRPTISAVELWREFIKRRYNSEVGYLNLEKMADDDFLKRNNLHPPGHPLASPKSAAVLYKLASQLKPEVKTISLADNNIRSGDELRGLNHYLPKLENLSLANNKLRFWRDLDQFAARKGKLEHLRELVLAGNPLREDLIKAGKAEQFKGEIARKFTSLELLDQEPLPKISFDAPQASTSAVPIDVPEATSFPCPMVGSFITGVDSTVVSNFLVRYLSLFDTDRPSLIAAYDGSATFSFSCNTTIPARSRLQGFHAKLPNQRKLEWSSYLSTSRNLNRITGETKTVNSLSVGGQNVVEAIQKLPKMRHDIAGPPENFVLDAFPIPTGPATGLMLNVHGQFTELPSEGIRSFDRTFILAPAPDGSPAKLAGWDVVILSDQFIIRNYSSPEWWKPGPITLFTGAPLPGSSKSSSGSTSQPQMAIPPDQQVLSTIPEPQRIAVVQVIERTKLNVKFAIDCLTQNGWEVERAIANFEQVKTTLSPDAFL